VDQKDSAGAAGVITAKNVDLSSCDRELIQYPEAIQPHGVMLTVDEHSSTILHASANCADLLGKGPQAIIGRSASGILGRSEQDLLASLRRMALDSGPVHVVRESYVASDRGTNLFAHRCGGLIILELEAAPERQAPSPNLYSELRTDIARLQETKNLQEFFDLAVLKIRTFTGYDRVMAYRFDEDGSGEVMAESRREDLEAYLGLHYPASDIPAPARRMFSLSWIRHLPDVDYVPVPLVGAKSPLITGPVDMSFAGLRSVSVMYTDYLRNMGVKSTIVMPLMKEGKLWGLISAMHHAGPRHISHETRMAAEFLAHTLSLLMSAKEDAEVFQKLLAMNGVRDRIIQALTLESDFFRALSSPEILPLVLAQVEAGGAAVVSGPDVATIGLTPPRQAVLDLVEWIGRQDDPLFMTDRLSLSYAPAKAFMNVASGVIAARVSPTRQEYVLWFRPEQVAIVNWAGDPRKPVEVSETDGEIRLRPRGSFALWKESVQGRSRPWHENEKTSVVKLRLAIGEEIVGRSERLERLNRELQGSHADLENFAHAASHDLKEYLRGIHHLATFLKRSHGDVLDDEGRRQVATILKITQRMDNLIDALLDHSRINRTDMAVEDVDLDDVVDAALVPFGQDLAEAGVQVRRGGSLGRAVCHPARVQEVFGNLIGNAITYNDKAKRWVEIGVVADRPPRYYVRDNGIGIAEADQHTIFQIFHRLHGRADFGGGSGVGLALARKIVERHGGRMWVQSVPGEGSTFYFTLAPEAAAEEDGPAVAGAGAGDAD
jgi:light-regulated signal transduction histidine kinase (bacteriophytochrome)